MDELKIDSLILYKGQAGRIVGIDTKKVAIEVVDRGIVNVRPKDVTLLHRGPAADFKALEKLKGDDVTAWELLAGERTNLQELADLIYGVFTPETAWSTYLHLEEGIYFAGTPADILVRTADEVEQRKARIRAKEEEARRWELFIERIKSGRHEPADEKYLMETVKLALGQRDASRILRTVGISESPEDAHAFLLNIGYWRNSFNPYPSRNGVSESYPNIVLARLPVEDRLDLTGMIALAIDDKGSQDPDDAISYEDGRLWVHVADVASLVTADSPADLEARGRGANLYLPDKTVPMLPRAATELLGLGLQETSPAISFELEVKSSGEVVSCEVHRTWIKATRLSYQEADELVDESPLLDLYKMSSLFKGQREENGAINIELPEVKVRTKDGQVFIESIQKLRSRQVVQEAMLMAGQGVAEYSLRNSLILPFTIQEPPIDPPEKRETVSDMFALRRTLKASHQSTRAAPHAGLGLTQYVQATSPLRRYLDLVVHQQLRAHLSGESALNDQQILERVGAAEAVRKDVRWAERQSNEHWILIYLLQNPGWVGEGVVVDRRRRPTGRRQALVLIPELGLETTIHEAAEFDLDARIQLELMDVDLAQQRAFFRLTEKKVEN